MKEYVYETTRGIIEHFDEKDLKYLTRFQEKPEGIVEEILVPFGIDNGPSVILHYVSGPGPKDLHIGIPGLLNGISKLSSDRRERLMEAINTINCRVRYLNLHPRNDAICASLSVPRSIDVWKIGPIAFECLGRTVSILDDEYSLISAAVYTDDPLALSGGELLHRMLEARHDLHENCGQTSEDEDSDTEVDN